jgi:hypothetical protein
MLPQDPAHDGMSLSAIRKKIQNKSNQGISTVEDFLSQC